MHFCSITFSPALIISHDLIPAYIISSIVCIMAVSVCAGGWVSLLNTMLRGNMRLKAGAERGLFRLFSAQ